MNSEFLLTFIDLAKSKNFSSTADHLFISQSTVTKRIAELEKELNMVLFSRTNRQVYLTQEGQMFLSYANRILELENAAIKEIHSSVRYHTFLRIGTTNSLYECHLFEMIEKFTFDSNNSVKITIGHSHDLLTSLQDGILDIVFSFLPFQKSGYECVPYHQDHLVLVTDYQNRQYEHGIRKANLAQLDYLMCNFALQEVGQFIRELFPLHHQFKLEIDNSTKLIPYLKGRNSYSFLPDKMVDTYIHSKELRMIPLLDFQTPVITSYCIGNTASRKLWSQFQC